MPKDVKKWQAFLFSLLLVVWVTAQGGGGIDGINCHKDISVKAMLSPLSFLGLGKQQDLWSY